MGNMMGKRKQSQSKTMKTGNNKKEGLPEGIRTVLRFPWKSDPFQKDFFLPPFFMEPKIEQRTRFVMAVLIDNE